MLSLAFGEPASLAALVIFILTDVAVFFVSLIILLNFLRAPSFVTLVTCGVVVPATVYLSFVLLNGASWTATLHWFVVTLTCSCFIQTYPSFEGQSANPTILILYKLHTAPATTQDQLVDYMNSLTLTSSEAKLETDKFVSVGPDGEPRLTFLGRVLAKTFCFYRKQMVDRSING